MKTLSSIALTLTFLSPLALAACAEQEQAEEAYEDQQGDAMVETGDDAIPPVTSPEGAADQDGLGPDEAYGQRGDQDGPGTVIPETGQPADIGEGDDTRIADD